MAGPKRAVQFHEVWKICVLKFRSGEILSRLEIRPMKTRLKSTCVVINMKFAGIDKVINVEYNIQRRTMRLV